MDLHIESIESAVNTAGKAAVFIKPCPWVPEAASIVGRRITLSGSVGDKSYRVAKEAAVAARIHHEILVIEVEENRVFRETVLPVGRR